MEDRDPVSSVIGIFAYPELKPASSLSFLTEKPTSDAFRMLIFLQPVEISVWPVTGYSQSTRAQYEASLLLPQSGVCLTPQLQSLSVHAASPFPPRSLSTESYTNSRKSSRLSLLSAEIVGMSHCADSYIGPNFLAVTQIKVTNIFVWVIKTILQL